MGPQRVGGPKPRKSGEPKAGAPVGGRPKISRFCSPLPPQFSFFLPSLGGVLVKFWWCLKRRDPQIYTFGVLGLSCEAPAAPKQGEQKKKRKGRSHSPSFPVPRATSNARSILLDGSCVFALVPVDGRRRTRCRIHNLQTGSTSASTHQSPLRRTFFSDTLADSTPTQMGTRLFLPFA